MSLDEGLSQFIGRLYEAVHDPADWHSAVCEVLKRTGSRVALIASVDVRHREFTRTAFYGSENSIFADGLREYEEELFRIDPSLIWASQNPGAGMCESAAIIPQADYDRDPFILWSRSRLGTTHWRVMYTTPVDDLSFALSLHPPAEEGAPTKESRALHRLLFNHMERALRLAARPPDLSTHDDAVILLDHSARVMAISPRAEALLKESDGLSITNRRLTASAPFVAQRLECLVRSAIDRPSTGGAGGGMRLHRPSGKPDLLALVSPCPSAVDHLPTRIPSAVVRIVESNSCPHLSQPHAMLFDLSPREIEVADALLHGHSIESLACELGISRDTARVHLRALFRKTATNRQSDLVRMLADVARH